ncbi:hypothetical protein BO82DRAFT_359322 [Aspergillus uvarum CBS 121591]|uniref:Uncharacterized protein n=1 Tax=Aspergillus uvarum CBS 121591 TaxID=1448315 RepID=A0A319BVF5_9EURO|nr:hypothetical protein BO82DRAFT_359322 [Aspergillus uvarum CBS 121591]PYH76207.1 hypothetical protein BO82DRAFT_359322 [Aspergillus uvarum CBS 121591]
MQTRLVVLRVPEVHVMVCRRQPVPGLGIIVVACWFADQRLLIPPMVRSRRQTPEPATPAA